MPLVMNVDQSRGIGYEPYEFGYESFTFAYKSSEYELTVGAKRLDTAGFGHCEWESQKKI